MDKFTKIFEKKVITNAINGYGPGSTNVSIVTGEAGGVSQKDAVGIVIGASWENRSAHRFNKNDLGTLIEILQDVHGCL